MRLKSSMKSKQKKIKVRKRNKVKVFFAKLLFFTIILVLLGAITFGVYYMCTSSSFDVKKINVVGNEKYTEKEILEKANISVGKNVFFTKKSKAKDKILKELPYVEDVRVNISGKDTLRIKITEREKKYVAINSETNEYIRLDKYGIILEKISSEQVEAAELLLFGIIFSDDIQLGKSITKSEIKKINNYDVIKEEYDKQKLTNQITSVKFENENVILILDYKLSVIVSSKNNLEYKIKFLKEILKEVSGRTGEVDMTKENPSFVEK